MIRAKIPTKARKLISLYEKEPINPKKEYEIIPDGKHKFKIYKFDYSHSSAKVYFLLEKDEETLYSYTPNQRLQQQLINLYFEKDFTDAYIIIYKKTYPDYIDIAFEFENVKDKDKQKENKENFDIDEIIKEIGG